MDGKKLDAIIKISKGSIDESSTVRNKRQIEQSPTKTLKKQKFETPFFQKTSVQNKVGQLQTGFCANEVSVLKDGTSQTADNFIENSVEFKKKVCDLQDLTKQMTIEINLLKTENEFFIDQKQSLASKLSKSESENENLRGKLAENDARENINELELRVEKASSLPEEAQRDQEKVTINIFLWSFFSVGPLKGYLF
jgi:hypothetical protein